MTQITIYAPEDANRSGIDITLSEHGVWVSGWYDGGVGIEPRFIPWDEWDALRDYAEGVQ